MSTTIEIEAIVLRPAEDISQSTAANIAAQFGGFYEQAESWRQRALAIKVADVNDKASIAQAREARLALKGVRVGAEKARKAMKEDSLRYGKAVDGAYNMLDHVIRPLESYLQEQEDIAERLESERLNNLRETRRARLQEADPDYVPTVDLATYFDAAFERILADVRDLRQLRLAREAKELADRLAREEDERQERERVHQENLRLQEAVRAQEAALKAEREAAAAKAREAELAAAAERAKIELEAARQRAIAEEAAKRERAQREVAEREAQALRDAEAKRIADEAAAAAKRAKDEAAAARKAAAAPDKAKLLAYASAVRGLIPPGVTTEDGRRVAADIAAKNESFARWIEAQAQTL
jgi:hypothetical protein